MTLGSRTVSGVPATGAPGSPSIPCAMRRCWTCRDGRVARYHRPMAPVDEAPGVGPEQLDGVVAGESTDLPARVRVPRELRGSRRRRARVVLGTGSVVAIATIAVVIGVVRSRSADDATDVTVRGPEPMASMPVSAGAGAPGTPLPDWFTVPEGTSLLAVVPPEIPPLVDRTDPSAASAARSWVATLAVTGDPRSVMESLRAQAGSQGLVVVPARIAYPPEAADSYCRRSGDTYRCLAFVAQWDPRTVDLFHPWPADQLRGARIELVRSPATGKDAAQSHLTIESRDDGTDPLRMLNAFGPPDAPIGPDAPAVPTEWVPLPAVGEWFGSPRVPLRLVGGSGLAAPVTSRCSAAGFTGYLRVRDGSDADAVLEHYVRQAERATSHWKVQAETQTASIQGRLGVETWTSVVDDDDFGYLFTMVRPSTGSAVIRVVACAP